MRIKNIGFWLVLFSIITLIFSPAIRYPFFQDDFFALVTTRITSFVDVLGLFKLIPEAVYWRPLGIQLYFGVMQFFGLGQPIWFHLVSLAVHLVNTYLVYKLVLAVGKNDRIAKLTAFFWGTSPIHYFALGWAVNFSFILVTTWAILIVLAFLSGRKLPAVLFFILGLLTNELALAIPGLVAFANWQEIRRGRFGRQRLLAVAIMLGVAAFYLFWRLTSGIKAQGDYSLTFLATFSTLRWYGLWTLGWSDIVRDNITGWFWWRFEFVESFWWVVWPYVLELGFLVWLLIWEVKRSHDLKIYKFYLWCGMWWIVGLTPILFFSKHLYSHYSAIAAIGIYWLIGKLLINWKRLQVIMIGVWLIVVGMTMKLNYLASWMGDHARHSQLFQSELLRQHKQVDLSATTYIYIVTNSSKAPLVLSEGYALNYLYDISPEKVHYTESAKDYLLSTGSIDSDTTTELEARESLATDGVIFDL